MKKTFPRDRFLLLFLMVLVLVGIVKYFDIMSYLNGAYVQENLPIFRAYVASNYNVAVGIYLLLTIGATAFSLPGSSLLTLMAGVLFGFIPGLLYAVMGLTMGATILFLNTRYIIGESIQARYKEQLVRINKNISLFGYYYIFIVRLVCLFPFSVTTIMASLSLISLRAFIGATFFGIIPGSLLYTYTGSSILSAASLSDACSYSFALMVGRVVAIPMVVFFIKDKFEKN